MPKNTGTVYNSSAQAFIADGQSGIYGASSATTVVNDGTITAGAGIGDIVLAA